MIKTPSEIEKMRSAGKILAKVLQKLEAIADEGMTLKDLDELARGLIKKADAEPAFLGYKPDGASKPFPATLCASVNEVVVHGVPTKRRLKDGDVLKLDLGVKFDGYYADAAITLGIGRISEIAQQLIRITNQALKDAIAVAKSGNTLGDIGYVIKKTATDHGFKVIKGLTGHGVGRELHEEPSILNEGMPGKGMVLKSGMVLAIEPMLSVGSQLIKQLGDDSYATVDGSLSSHFEHTIVITEKKAEVLTQI